MWEKVIFVIILAGGLLLGAGVSRWRERRAQPIWTWAIAFGVAWAWTLYRVGSLVWLDAETAQTFSWIRLAVVFVVAFPIGFMGCVVAAMTAGKK